MQADFLRALFSSCCATFSTGLDPWCNGKLQRETGDEKQTEEKSETGWMEGDTGADEVAERERNCAEGDGILSRFDAVAVVAVVHVMVVVRWRLAGRGPLFNGRGGRVEGVLSPDMPFDAMSIVARFRNTDNVCNAANSGHCPAPTVSLAGGCCLLVEIPPHPYRY